METEIMNAFVSALGTVLVALLGYVAQRIASYLKAKGITEKLAGKQYLVDIAVNAVEQIYQYEDGPRKYNLAKDEAVKLLNDNGLAITDEELESFIEASVKSMNDGFNSVKGKDEIPTHTKE